MEKKFKGTKGKWRLGQIPHEHKGDIGIRYFVIADIINRDDRNRDDRFIFNQFVSRNEVMDIHEEAFNNAKLIAAAPDLLEALEDLLDELSGQSLESSTSLYIQKAKEAINKALD